MKKIIFTIFSISFGLLVMAQNQSKQGEVVYQETMKLNFKFEGMSEQMLERMPKERNSKKILYFNETASSYQASKEQDERMIPGARGHGGGGMHFMMSSPDNKVYIDFKKNQIIEQREFMTRIFLITGEPTPEGWKLTGNQKMIMDYPCQEATQITEQDTVVAWFAPSIPVSAGPGNYVNLPGLVLEVDINHGKRKIIAQNIDLKEIDKNLIVKPNKGKKVSREEFRKIVDEKTKEMGAESGSGGTVIIRR